MNAFKKLNREKSFDEARTAVQSQIERIFQKAAAAKNKDNEANGNSIGSSGDGGGFVSGGGGVEVVSPLPVHGITLKVSVGGADGLGHAALEATEWFGACDREKLVKLLLATY